MLERAMRERGWSQVRLASELGVTQSAVSKWLSGKRCPDGWSAVGLQKMLGVPIDSWPNERAA
jgi:predicted transcriptional regulator